MKSLHDAPLLSAHGELCWMEFDQQGRLVNEREFKNLVVDEAFGIIPGVLGRDPNKQIEFISIGTGGDYELQDPAPPVDLGTRNPPEVSDQGTRIELFRAAIVSIEFPAANSVRFYAVLQALDANSTDINEFALLTSDGSCFSHEVNEPNAVAPNRAVKFTKNNGLIVVLRWTLSFFKCSGNPLPVAFYGTGGTVVVIAPPLP